MTALRLTAAELGRLRRRRTALLLWILPALVGFLRVWMHAATATPGPDGELANGFAPMADGLKVGGAAMTLVLLLAGSLLIVREREAGTLALQYLIGARTTVFASKLVTMIVILLTGGLLMTGACAGAAALWFDLGPLLEDGFEMATAAELWTDVRGSLMAAFTAWFATACFALFVSTCVSGTGSGMAIALIPFVLFDFLRGLLGEAWQHLFVTHVPFLGDGPALARLPDVARGYSDVFFEAGEIAAACSVSCWQATGLMIAGAIVMRLRTPL